MKTSERALVLVAVYFTTVFTGVVGMKNSFIHACLVS